MTAPARATSDLEAANLALGIAGEPAIASFDEPDRTAAREVSKWYGTALDKALSRTDWNFASTWSKPARVSPDSVGRLKRRFVLPSDCVEVREVYDGEPAEETRIADDGWQVENAKVALDGADVVAKVLVTNAESPTLRYTARVSNVALWDAEFLLAFAHRLARYIAPKLGKSANEVAELKAEAKNEADEAAASDAREGARKQVSRETSWIRARRGWRG